MLSEASSGNGGSVFLSLWRSMTADCESHQHHATLLDSIGSGLTDEPVETQTKALLKDSANRLSLPTTRPIKY